MPVGAACGPITVVTSGGTAKSPAFDVSAPPIIANFTNYLSSRDERHHQWQAEFIYRRVAHEDRGNGARWRGQRLHFSDHARGSTAAIGFGYVPGRPTITALPASGAAGAQVLIQGTQLNDVTSVTIGGQEARIVGS